MSLFFKFKSKNAVSGRNNTHESLIGQDIPEFENEEILSITATLDEKDVIEWLFPMLKSNQCVIIYPQPFAGLIFENIKGHQLK